MNELKGTISAIAYIAMFIITVGLLISFFRYVVPIIYPMLLEGRFWAAWLISGIFIGPLMMLIAYVSMRVTNFLFAKWKSAIFLTILAFLYLSALAFLFSNLLPSDFEPFNSVTLPALILAITLIIFSRTKYAKRFKDH